MRTDRTPCLALLAALAIALTLASDCADDGTEETPGDELATPVPDIATASRAFGLYYRERVERAVLAYQRFMVFGDTTFAATLGKSGVARQGSEYEVVPGPNDNNQIGLSVWTTWNAYRALGGRTLELALIRLLNGLSFFEAISGHPGVTSRMVYPGWTRVVDGVAGTVTRTRGGAVVQAPEEYSADLRDEMLHTFWDGVQVTYREDVEDILMNYMPATETGPYATTYSFSALQDDPTMPSYLRSSDCCASLMRTPAGYPWEGAYWGNHNSRDNFPDLSLGIVSAMQVMRADTDSPPELQAAAARVIEAGHRIGDLIAAHDAIMTVDEHHTYNDLINSGAVRPDGETEVEDLGTLADCQMAFLSRAISSTGLSEPLPAVKAPASIEYILVDAVGEGVDCPVPDGARVCTRLELHRRWFLSWFAGPIGPGWIWFR